MWNGSVFTVVGEGGTIMTSSDGTNWSTQTIGTANYKWIAGSGSKMLATSDGNGSSAITTDGLNWSAAAASGITNHRDLIYTNDYTFISSGQQWISGTLTPVIYATNDGASWTGFVDSSGATNITIQD